MALKCDRRSLLSSQWQLWRKLLPHLEKVSVPRFYNLVGFGKIIRREIHAFSDTSKDAIGATTYIRLFNEEEKFRPIIGRTCSDHEHHPPRVVCRCPCVASN